MTKSTPYRRERPGNRRVHDTSEGVNPLTLPWNLEPTTPDEQGWWEDLRWDLMEAFDDGELTREEAYWYITLMADMFDSEVMRHPTYVTLARLCFFADRGEA
jgi:hypothetical protein